MTARWKDSNLALRIASCIEFRSLLSTSWRMKSLQRFQSPQALSKTHFWQFYLNITYSDEVVHHEHISWFDVLVDNRRFLVVAETQSGNHLRCDDSRFVGSCPLASFFLLLDKLDQRPTAAEFSDEEADVSEDPFRLLVFQKVDKFDHISVIWIILNCLWNQGRLTKLRESLRFPPRVFQLARLSRENRLDDHAFAGVVVERDGDAFFGIEVVLVDSRKSTIFLFRVNFFTLMFIKNLIATTIRTSLHFIQDSKLDEMKPVSKMHRETFGRL